jgi:fumarate reductase subunit D
MTPGGRRSNAPIFWGLFGAGGMLAALLGPMLVLITGVLVPLGLLLPPATMEYTRMLALARHWAGAAFLFVVVSLFAWHAAHRLYHSLHDVGVRTGAVAQAVCYGAALIVTLAAGASLALLA